MYQEIPQSFDVKNKNGLFHNTDHFLQAMWYDFILRNVFSLRLPITISWVVMSNTEQYKAMLMNTKAIKSTKT